MEVALIKPQGFCSGVTRAIKLAKQAKEEHPDKNIYILGMLAHNQILINDLSKEGFITLTGDEFKEIEKLNEGDILIFTAHGHSEKLDKIASDKGLITYDATCFKVKDNLNKIKKEIEANHQVIYIGQSGHKESNAALSVSKNVSLYDTKLLINYHLITDCSPFVINQTTLNFYELKGYHNDILKHFPNARIENEICNATRIRQEAILKIDKDTDLIVIVGHSKSSNSNKLFDIAKANYPQALVVMVNNLEEFKKIDIKNKRKATIGSGASTPQYIVDEIYKYLLAI
ncbi:MAG: 4-hydroxy-3-methylbut-2-enyl diphosphate reductase [Bacilli bacterium]|nr:4-hydroxy-3-methylbut-2-enyl diphosphate reductase [Bacilli bacterium]